MKVFSDRILRRIDQIFNELQASCATGHNFYDRLREFHTFCVLTPEINLLLSELPTASYDFDLDWRLLADYWQPGLEGYSMRWDAIVQMVNGGSSQVDKAWLQLSASTQSEGLHSIIETFFFPIVNFIQDHIEYSGEILHLLLRYKRWVEWFKAPLLRDLYSSERGGENALDLNLRQFLFESGIDYPFSQPESPKGKADVIAGIETSDPLVLEIKIWDSSKNYNENRLRDGLRQAVDYTTKYGKDRGYIAVFNIDRYPLIFESPDDKSEWPPKIQHGGRMFYFIEIHLADISEPISVQDKGKRVGSIHVKLAELLSD